MYVNYQRSCARPVHALAVHRHPVGVRVDRVRLLRHGLASQRFDRVLDAAQRIYKTRNISHLQL